MTRRARWLSPGFLTAVAVLAVSAATINVAVSALDLHFKKLPIPPAMPLADIPARLGPWVQVSIDEPLDHATQEELGTDRYVFRDYVDTRRVSPAEVAAFDGLDARDRKQMAELLQLSRPTAVINCAVTYYTGMVDTVAHIPERCYVANGYLPRGHEVATWAMGDDFAGNDGRHDVRVETINFDDPTTRARQTRVAYLFFANGQWEADSLAVRQRLQSLTAAHGFYSKVELRSVIPDARQSADVMADFLRSALPAVARCYPDFAAVERGGVTRGGVTPGGVTPGGVTPGTGPTTR